MSQSKHYRRGATMVAVAILLPILLLLSAIAVNLAHIQVVNTKVQIVTDVSVRAAGAAYVETGVEADGLVAAQQLASLNPIESTVLAIASSDLDFGLSQRNAHDKAYTFTSGTNGNSVRLTTNSFAGGAGDAVQPFFSISGANFDIRPVCTATHSQTTLDVAVLVDQSGSMAFAANETSGGGTPAAAPPGWSYGDAAPPQSRWLDLVAAVNGFCNELTQTSKIEKVALCGYRNIAFRHVNLTDELSRDFRRPGRYFGQLRKRIHQHRRRDPGGCCGCDRTRIRPPVGHQRVGHHERRKPQHGNRSYRCR